MGYSDAARKHLKKQGSLLISPVLDSALLWEQKPEINSSWANKYNLDFKTTLEFIDKSNRANQEKIKIEENRRIRTKKINKYIIAGCIVFIIVLLSSAIRFKILHNEARKLKEEQESANKELTKSAAKNKELQKKAEQKAEDALKARKSAEFEKEKALSAQKLAEDEREKADEEKDKADEAKEKADKAKEKS